MSLDPESLTVYRVVLSHFSVRELTGIAGASLRLIAPRTKLGYKITAIKKSNLAALKRIYSVVYGQHPSNSRFAGFSSRKSPVAGQRPILQAKQC
jgi:hypothetical protein